MLDQSFSGLHPNTAYVHNRAGQVLLESGNAQVPVWSPPANGTTGYTANALNQYTAVGGASPTYNTNGNLTAFGSQSFGYDAENRLKTATVGATSIAYKYDPFGQRLSKTVNGTLTRYLAPTGEVLAEYNSSGTLTARYVPGVFLDQPVLMERPANGTKYFYQQDRLGSVSFLTNSTGAVVESYAYGPFGETASASSVGNPYRYAGREYEPETGLYYNRARYLSPALGRFLQPDPIGYTDSLNLYGYVGNDPFNFIDPSGLRCVQNSSGGMTCSMDDPGPFSSDEVTRVNRAYTDAVNKLLGHPNGAADIYWQGKSFTATAGDVAKILADTIMKGGEISPTDPTAHAGTLGGPLGFDTPSGGLEITIYQKALNSNDDRLERTIVHEGLHGHPGEIEFKELLETRGLKAFNESHQHRYNEASSELLKDEGPPK